MFFQKLLILISAHSDGAHHK